MQVRFRYTKQEFLLKRKLNGIEDVSAWTSFLFVVCCLLPSFLTSLFVSSRLTLAVFGVIGVALLLRVVRAYTQAPARFDERERMLDISPAGIRDSCSHSVLESEWQYYEHLVETEHDFRLEREKRFYLFPKRIFSDEQSDEFRRLAANIGHSAGAKPSQDTLTHQYFQALSSEDVVEFAYQDEDIKRAMYAGFSEIDLSEAGQPAKKRASNRSFLLLLFMVAVAFIFLFLRVPNLPGAGASAKQYFLLLLIVTLPFFMSLGLRRWLRVRCFHRMPAFPTDPVKFAIGVTGFTVGFERSVSFYDWRDVVSFVKSPVCLGFKTAAGFVHILPWRVFPGDTEMNVFLARAIDYYRSHQHSFSESSIAPTTAIETGNPYQSPGN
ncbi:MAG: hypothetical protein ACI814_000208 [Mariniblastus sp.]|jgi:hypothetical protein